MDSREDIVGIVLLSPATIALTWFTHDQQDFNLKPVPIFANFRTDKEAYSLVKDVIDFTGTEFHSLRLVSDLCYHLDTAMLNLSKGHALVFPPAFDTESYNLIK